MNWLDFMCRVGTTVAAVAGTAAGGAAAGALSGFVGGPVGAASGAVVGASMGVVGGLAKSGDICDQAAHDMYMQQKCEALDNGEIGYLPKSRSAPTLPTDSKGMILP